MQSHELTQLNVRVPVGMITVLDTLAEQAHVTRAQYLAQLVKRAQVENDTLRDAQTIREHGQTKLARRVAENSMGLLSQGRDAAARG